MTPEQITAARCKKCNGAGTIRVQRFTIFETDSAAESEFAFRSEVCPECSARGNKAELDITAARERCDALPYPDKPWKFNPHHEMFVGETNMLEMYDRYIDIGRGDDPGIKTIGEFLEHARTDLPLALDAIAEKDVEITELKRQLAVAQYERDLCVDAIAKKDARIALLERTGRFLPAASPDPIEDALFQSLATKDAEIAKMTEKYQMAHSWAEALALTADERDARIEELVRALDTERDSGKAVYEQGMAWCEESRKKDARIAELGRENDRLKEDLYSEVRNSAFESDRAQSAFASMRHAQLERDNYASQLTLSPQQRSHPHDLALINYRDPFLVHAPWAVKRCTSADHRWIRNGNSGGKLRALCANCGVTAGRVEIADDANKHEPGVRGDGLYNSAED